MEKYTVVIHEEFEAETPKEAILEAYKRKRKQDVRYLVLAEDEGKIRTRYAFLPGIKGA